MALSRKTGWVLSVSAALVLLVLVFAALVWVPVLTHKSAGGSGQEIPRGFVASTSAVGDDGRERVLRVTSAGEPARLADVRPGEELTVSGTGFNAEIGIYVSVCAVAKNGEKPSPCLGGRPEKGSSGPAGSAWVTNDWAWRGFATDNYEVTGNGDGSFTARIVVPEPITERLDCVKKECAVTTRSDHTAGNDRVQDLQLPIRYASTQ